MRKESVSLSILIPILVFVMTALAGVIIWVVLSPYFGVRLHAPISTVPCEITHTSLHQQQNPSPSKSPSSSTLHSYPFPDTSPSAEQCYRAEDVIALNKALNMSDTISLLGLLLAIFAFIAPIFSYLTLRKERKYLESLIQEELEKSTALLQDAFNPLPLILRSVEEFKSAYQIDAYRKASRAGTESDEIMRRAATEAHQIAIQLLSLLNRKANANDAFNNITCYISTTDPSVIENVRHIQMLKIVIRQLYDSSYLGSDERKAALREFLQATLKMSLEDFINSTSSETAK